MELDYDKYLERVTGVGFWKTVPKKLYIRFRINCVKVGDIYYNRSGEIYFNNFIRTICDNPHASYWKVFREYDGVQFNKKLAIDLFENNKFKLIICNYKFNLSGLLFENTKYKEMFIIKYGEMFPDSCILK